MIDIDNETHLFTNIIRIFPQSAVHHSLLSYFLWFMIAYTLFVLNACWGKAYACSVV